MQRICSLITAICLAAGTGETAQLDSAWVAVQRIRPGETVRVHVPGHQYKGTLTSVSEDTISVSTSSGQISTPRPDVALVYLKTPSHRLRNTLIGAAVGTAIAVVLYATLGALFRNETGENHAGELVVLPIGVLTLVGAVSPTGTMRKIYDRDKPGSVH